MTPAIPPDESARHRVRDDLDATLFVEAGAGSGKTATLVDRVLALVASGVPMAEIAAITFTEKAAAELRDRIRQGLERQVGDPANGEDSREVELREALVLVGGVELVPRCQGALVELDGAAISTLHSFAQRILSEHPIEAGLPPGVEILDEISSDMEFDDRWERFLLDLYDREDLARPILLGLCLGVDEEKLRDVARAFNANWDLVMERGGAEAQPIGSVDLGPLLGRLDDLTAQLAGHRGEPDSMSDKLEEVAEYRHRLAVLGERAEQAAGSDRQDAQIDAEIELIEALTAPKPRFATNGQPYKSLGRKADWPPETLDKLKEELFAVGEFRDDLRRGLITEVIERLAAEVARFTIEEADRRASEGRLEFHDLLVRARKLLRDPDDGPTVRAALRTRYSRLLLDEFQDTDPIQIDLATLLATPPEQVDSAWRDLRPDPGRLFLVGDPKQSIYRFRRADIRLFLEASKSFGPPLQLYTNFRSAAPITNWVNEVFGSLLVAVEGSQPGYQALASMRAEVESGPAVSVVGVDPLADSLLADPVREAEAEGVAAAVLTAVGEQWTVEDPDGSTRAASLGDITILIPARTSLPALERALEGAGVPYRAETSSLVYSTRQVRDLMAVLRAVDDPTDELALVTALRSVAFGCGDDDLYSFRQLGGRWNHQAPVPESIPPEHPVREAFEWLSVLHERRTWLSPSEVVDAAVRERRLMEYGVAIDSHRDVWRRMRFIVDQARAFTDATGGSLREFLVWARHQADEQARVAEAVLPETDSDSVRIMTIHAAKGLEFPIAILSGMTTAVGGRRSGVQVAFPPDGGIGYHFDKNTVTDEFERFKPLDEQMDFHEKLRLLYVACTRARDHLIVSVHRKARSKEVEPEKMTGAELLVYAGAAASAVELSGPGPRRRRQAEPERPALVPFETWQAELSQTLESSSRRRAVAATQIASAAADDDPGLQKFGRNLDLPPWRKGRYGTAIGRAVHGLLQTIDLHTGVGLAAAAAAQAQSEGVAGHEVTIEALAASALASPTVREAADSRHWRELFVAVPVAGRLLEGYVDLLYERGDGLVVVDYKTDAWTEMAELDAKLDRYRLQGASYVAAVQQVTGRPVVACRFLFLAEDGAVARDVVDLADAVAEVAGIVPQLLGGGEAGVE